MKKILLATTLIAATTGYAAAEVAVSGSARMGIVSLNNNATGQSIGAQFSSRFRVVFTASGETDGGLTFGASVRNDQSGVGNTSNSDSTVYLSGAFGKITMGDTGNAADALVGQVDGVGYTGLRDLNELSWVGKSTTGVLYEYSAGALTAALGVGQTQVSNDFYSIAVKYSTDAYSAALGYENNDSTGISQVSLGASATFSGVTVKVRVNDGDDAPFDGTEYAVSAGYTINGIGLTAFYADAFNTNALDLNAGLKTKRYGLGAAYDLGGGAAVAGGIAREEGTDTIFDLGVTMKF